LTTLSAFNSNGLLTQTAGDTFAARTIAGTSDQIAVTNGDGVAGNPTLALVIPSEAEARAGTDGNKAMPSLRVHQAISEKVRYYASSSPVAFSAGGLAQWAHGLGGAPSSITVVLECTTAEFGYSIGDRVYMGAGSSWGDTTQAVNHGIYCDATNINIRWDALSSQLAVLGRKDTGLGVLITPASWRVYVTAQMFA
jgi:hypothetical protein